MVRVILAVAVIVVAAVIKVADEFGKYIEDVCPHLHEEDGDGFEC